MLNRYKSFVLIAILAIAFMSCIDTRKATYFNGIDDTVIIPSDSDRVSPVIQKNDIINVTISSLNKEASDIFNISSNSTNGNTVTNAGSGQSGTGYLVSSDGNIQLPILGLVKVAGSTTNEVKNLLTNLLNEKKLLKDPIVTIRHLNYEITVLGEVGRPAVINVPSEKISLLKAIGLAGDITAYGKKDNVLLIREINGRRTVKRIDLNSANFLSSSYYYLQPNDVVYVEANKNKVASASALKQNLPLIISSLSFLVVVVDRLLK